jgi:transcriptional regulator with GAF, ATPase, and Fis domain
MSKISIFKNYSGTHWEVTTPPHYEFGIIHTSDNFKNAINKIRILNEADLDVSVYGEPGTGKELMANAFLKISGLSDFERSRQQKGVISPS